MAREMRVSFPGGKRVDVHFGEYTVPTDQSVRHGGDGSAPEPFDYFFVSLLACVGIYALEFCRTREIPTEGLDVILQAERNRERRLYSPIRIIVRAPHGFPQKYRDALLRAVNLCAVKRHIVEQPEFDVRVEMDSEEAGGGAEAFAADTGMKTEN